MPGSFDDCENQLNYCDDNRKVHYDHKRDITFCITCLQKSLLKLEAKLFSVTYKFDNVFFSILEN